MATTSRRARRCVSRAATALTRQIIPNSYSIHRDARIYPEPELFKPERFIRDGELVGVPRAERGHFGFGCASVATWTLLIRAGGRRVCPGLYIAERSLYIVIARMLWAFDFAHAKDPSGREVPIGPSFAALSSSDARRPGSLHCGLQHAPCRVQVLDHAAWRLGRDGDPRGRQLGRPRRVCVLICPALSLAVHSCTCTSVVQIRR